MASSTTSFSLCNEKPSHHLPSSILTELSSARSLLRYPFSSGHKLSSSTPSRYAYRKSISPAKAVLAERPALSGKSSDGSFSVMTNTSSGNPNKSTKKIAERQQNGSVVVKKVEQSNEGENDPAAVARATARAVNAAVYDPAKLEERFKWRPFAVSQLNYVSLNGSLISTLRDKWIDVNGDILQYYFPWKQNKSMLSKYMNLYKFRVLFVISFISPCKNIWKIIWIQVANWMKWLDVTSVYLAAIHLLGKK